MESKSLRSVGPHQLSQQAGNARSWARCGFSAGPEACRCAGLYKQAYAAEPRLRRIFLRGKVVGEVDKEYNGGLYERSVLGLGLKIEELRDESVVRVRPEEGWYLVFYVVVGGSRCDRFRYKAGAKERQSRSFPQLL